MGSYDHQCEVSKSDLDRVRSDLEYEIRCLKDEVDRLRSDLKDERDDRKAADIAILEAQRD